MDGSFASRQATHANRPTTSLLGSSVVSSEDRGIARVSATDPNYELVF